VADPQNLIAAPTMVGTMKVNPVLFRGIGSVSAVMLVRERSALSDPYCHLAWMSACGCMCVCDFEVKYLGNQGR